MGILTEDMIRLVREQKLGFVATVRPDGTPNLSPKGALRDFDDDHLVFADIRSPQTIANLGSNPVLEINVVDVLSRRGYRFRGAGRVHRSGTAFERGVAVLQESGVAGPIRAIVLVRVERALPLVSPSYDRGATLDEIRSRWRTYWLGLWDRECPSSHAAPPNDGAAPPEGRAKGPGLTDLGPAGVGGTYPRWTRGDLEIDTSPHRVDLDRVHDFLSNRSYWSRDIPREVVERAVRNSIVFGLYDRGEQVGFARVTTDRATFAYLADVFVLEEYRGRGLSVWLVQTIAAHPELQGLRRWLLATRDAHGLYEKIGFTPLSDPGLFMERFDPGVYSSPHGAASVDETPHGSTEDGR